MQKSNLNTVNNSRGLGFLLVVAILVILPMSSDALEAADFSRDAFNKLGCPGQYVEFNLRHISEACDESICYQKEKCRSNCFSTKAFQTCASIYLADLSPGEGYRNDAWKHFQADLRKLRGSLPDFSS